jgi:GT2 family glycosyltransferase
LDLSLVIVNWNTRELLLACLASVYETVAEIRFEVWLVDNGSSDGSVGAVRARFPGVRIIENSRNLGFAAANNRAFKEMAGRYALLLNTDTVLQADAVGTLFRFMERTPDAAMACGQLLNPDGSRQNSIANFPSLLALASNETLLRLLMPKRFPSKRRRYTAPVRVDSCIGAALMVRRSAMDEVGLLDEAYFFFMEETDWAYRMGRAGWSVYFVPKARIVHYQGQSVGPRVNARILFYRSRYIYLKKWHPRSYRLFTTVIFTRLLVNALLAGVGTVVTFGLKRDLRHRLSLYRGLISWHLDGCPDHRTEGEGPC